MACCISLRVRARGSLITITDLQSESSLSDLKRAIQDATQISPSNMTLLAGYPPKTVQNEENNSLSSLGIKTGETIIVKESSGAHPVANEQKICVISELTKMYRVKVPANNSCLFTSVFYLIQGGKLDLDAAPALRDMIAQVVADDPKQYDAVFLEGKTNEEYCKFIRNKDTWGGGIEIKILGDFYRKEISVIDVLRQRVFQFGQDQNYSERMFLLYDGLHYDPVVLEETGTGKMSTIFPIDQDELLIMGQQLATKVFESRDFRNTSQFLLLCMQCDSPICGHQDAKEHARNTGHTQFSEIAR